MHRSRVYFYPSTGNETKQTALAAKKVLQSLWQDLGLTLTGELPIKIHPGAVGNTTFLRPGNYSEVIEFLKSKKLNPYFIETCMESSNDTGKLQEFKAHGFNTLPVIIADGSNGDQSVSVQLTDNPHFKTALISQKLAESKQILVVTHFKGHCMAGFGGAIKMLGIGFASGRGKAVVHSTKSVLSDKESIDWDASHLPGQSKKWVYNWNDKVVSSGSIFRQRFSQYAWAATQNKQIIYLQFAVDIVDNCDCEASQMQPVYQDLGVFASMDPVAIDKCIFDQLSVQAGEAPFEGEDIFEYAQSIGLGSVEYELVNLQENH